MRHFIASTLVGAGLAVLFIQVALQASQAPVRASTEPAPRVIEPRVSSPTASIQPPPRMRIVPHHQLLQKVTLDSPRIPPLGVKSLPADLQNMPTEHKKDNFIKLLLPAILHINAEYRHLRQQIQQGAPDPELFRRYKLDPGDSVERLLKRVDSLPPSLVLAQAALESAWGTSRFAQQATNLFGHWTWQQDQGLVPREREEGKTHLVRVFSTVEDSLRAYYRNINTNSAYRELRDARQRTRDSRKLAEYLFRYSQLGHSYADELKAIIDYNDFQRFDDYRLARR